MSKLEQLTPNAAVRGILPDSLVTVVSVQWFGSEALELTYKTPNGKVANELLYRRPRPLPAGFIAPCLPSKTDKLPSGSQWLHEIKHDGFRVIARKDGAKVRLYSRPGNDLTYRFPLIVESLARLRSRSCIIDGEAVACDESGGPSFDHIINQFAEQPVERAAPLTAEAALDQAGQEFGAVC
jgi:ATP-dependent DNA ligase